MSKEMLEMVLISLKTVSDAEDDGCVRMKRLSSSCSVLVIPDEPMKS
jgi:hypothetical protein